MLNPEFPFKDLLTIKKRLLSWYVGKDISLDPRHTPYLASFRWWSLLGTSIPTDNCEKQNGNIKCSHILYGSYLCGEGLYCRNCSPGKWTFEFVFHKILHPMAIDYQLWLNIDQRACMLAKTYGCDD